MSLSTTPEREPPGDWAQARVRVAELAALIDTLTAERQHLQAALDAIIYPVLTLPPEITSHIFMQSIPEDMKPTRRSAPLLLTQICHQWRAIALATPQLWQSCVLDRKRRRGDCGMLLRMWLERSGSLPLFLSFRTPDGAQAQSLVDNSLIHCRRWREIEIPSQANLHAPRETFPILRKVALSRWAGTRRVTIIDAPMLHEASIMAANAGSLDMQLPWTQLTSLTLETLTFFPECLPILSSCSKLQTFKYRCQHPNNNGVTTYREPHLMFESLQSLEINDHSSPIISHLTLPHLRHLTLPGEISLLHLVEALSSRSSFQLQQLTIGMDKYTNPRPQLLQAFFRLCPTVAELTLIMHGMRELCELVGSLASSDTLPLMKTLVIDALRVHDDYDSLLDVLRARTETLKTFDLTLRPHKGPKSPSASSPFPEAAMAQFRALITAGLEVRIDLQSKLPPTPPNAFQ
ncbi:hypothetical protein FB451DRAFT_1365468 [Mycena latifolia]|nr:hypothetical protein FB451DRAFT_1365468 [Mycena latifolia]